jgi:AraC-like DNA-binding protein
VAVNVARHETESAHWEVARRPARDVLRPYLLSSLEGWTHVRGGAMRLREVPFPGVPLILNLGPSWIVETVPGSPESHDSFLAGLHTTPSIVEGGASWACIELRLTPLGARRLLGRPMHELTNRTLDLEDLVPRAGELTERLREADSWSTRFDLLESFLVRRLADSAPASPAIEWSWGRLRTSHGRAPISGLAAELGWSHRRLIARFRDHVGLTPKALARVIRFDRAVGLLGRPAGESLAAVAYDCGYFDQAHMNRDFRELAGTTPASLVARRSESGAVAA